MTDIQPDRPPHNSRVVQEGRATTEVMTPSSCAKGVSNDDTQK